MKIIPTKSERRAMKRTRVTLRNANNRRGKSHTFTLEGVSMRDIKLLLGERVRSEKGANSGGSHLIKDTHGGQQVNTNL